MEDEEEDEGKRLTECVFVCYKHIADSSLFLDY